jgi:inner membrane protein involved in colicin E2 resistance
VRDFRLVVDTDFREVDFPPGSLSPSEHTASGGAWHGEWAFDSLISSAPVALSLPEQLNPGPLASRITFFAPVSLLFFFFVVGVLATVQRKELHPMHFFMIGCAFFAFHLLFAYLVDHVPVTASFALSALVSLLLVVSYARLFVGWRFALRELGISQLLYLVLFSYSFFWEGFTGLAITLGAIGTLFVMMQVTGRLDWGKAEAAPGPTPPAPGAPDDFGDHLGAARPVSF